MQLRDKQHEALTSVRDAYTGGLRRVVVVATVAFGKTVVFANLPKYLGLKPGEQMLILAHREELLTQAADKVRTWNPTLRVSIEKGQEYYADENADVIIASVPTLGRAGSTRIQRFDKNRVKVVVVDEAHHGTAETYLNIYNYFGLLDPTTDKLLVGVTATPGRSDGEGLVKVFQRIVFQYTMRQGIKDGWLADLRAVRVKVDVDLDNIKKTGGDYDQRELAEQLNTPRNNLATVKAFLQEGGDRKAIGFSVDVQHAKDLAAVFNRYGVKAAAVWGEDPERAWKLACHRGPDAMRQYCIDNDLPVPSDAALRELELQVLFNFGVLTEGYDDWRVSCVIWARPTQSQLVLIQAIGRGLRIDSDTGNLIEARRLGKHIPKGDCLVLDLAGNTKRHSLVTVPSLFGMNAKMDLEGKSAIAAVEYVEQMAKEHPEVDFKSLGSLDDIDILIEEAEVWNVKFPEEVAQNATMTWMSSYDGGYVLSLPSSEQMTIKQNMLDQWEIYTMVNGQAYRGQRATLEEAFMAGENLITQIAPDALPVLLRNAAWNEDPVTPGQMKALKRLYKGKTVPENLTKGQASRLIDRAKQDEAKIPATPEQLAFIRRFNKNYPPDLTKAGAKKMIAMFIKGKVTRVKA